MTEDPSWSRKEGIKRDSPHFLYQPTSDKAGEDELLAQIAIAYFLNKDSTTNEKTACYATDRIEQCEGILENEIREKLIEFLSAS